MEITESPFFAPQRPQIETPQRRKRRGVFFASLVIHGVLIVVLASVEQKKTLPKQELPPPIAARLVFTPVKAPPGEARSPQDSADQLLQEQQLPEAQPVTPQATPPEQADSQNAENSSREADTAPPKAVEPPDDQLIQRDSMTTTDSAPKAPVNPVQDTGTRRSSSLTSRQALDNFFSKQKSQAQQREAEIAAGEFRKQRTSPELTNPRKDEPEVETNAPPPVNVDCSDTTTSVLAVIAGYTGGRVTCTNRSNGFEKFIDKRLNKSTKEENKPW